MPQNVIILGSTGSIGKSTLRVIDEFSDEFNVVGLSCKTNLKVLEDQIKNFKPEYIAIESPQVVLSDEYKKLKNKYSEVNFFEGIEGVEELASKKSDIVVSAIVGAAGLKPNISALKSTKRIALANKETLVMAGGIFMDMVKEAGVELVPVDSEHSALFLLLQNLSNDDVNQLVLTASGGSLREVPIDELKSVSPQRALEHPTWDMGKKITIDSATLMNKGLEVIEAHHLFGFSFDQINVIIHQESVIHSMIETIDGAFYAHLGVADMAHPIMSALKYPVKGKNSFGRLDLGKLKTLNFRDVDHERCPALGLCYEAGRAGGIMPAILNAANEIAVDAFINHKIQFTDIVKIVKKTMKNIGTVKNPGIEDVFQADIEARDYSYNILEEK